MKVLSLAWKYHPSITSGVGVACEGINNALSKMVDLKVIYPKVTKIQVSEELILGSEDLTVEQRKLIEEEYIEFLENGNFELAVSLDPYYTISQNRINKTSQKKQIKETSVISTDKREIRRIKKTEKLLFDEVDVFGENVKEKIYIYNRLVEMLAENLEFDVIHAHDWMTFLAGISLKDKYNKPLVIHVHSLEYDRVGHKDASWVYQIERYSMSKANKVIAVSEYTKGLIEGNYGLSSNSIQTIYNATSIPEKIEDFSIKKGGNFKVLFAGRIDGNKGIEYFMEIAMHVLRRSKNVEFIVVGRGKSKIRFDKIKGYKEIASNFKYLGFVERDVLFSLYQNCDVLCMPSISEPFGLTAIEAAYMGLPVVLSTKTGASEILNRTPKADFWDTDQFANHIMSIKNNPRLRQRIIENNKEDISNLSWESSARKMVDLFDGLLRR